MFKHKEVTLRKLAGEDLSLLLELKAESWSGTHSVALVNESDQKRWFESLDKNVIHPAEIVMMGNHKSEEGILTSCFGIFKVQHINWVNRTADVGWDVFYSHRGKGFGHKLVEAGTAFCFQILNLRRLTAEILLDNYRSQKCAERVGYVNEGCKREAILRQGETTDSLIWGYLWDDWFDRRPHEE